MLVEKVARRPNAATTKTLTRVAFCPGPILFFGQISYRDFHQRNHGSGSGDSCQNEKQGKEQLAQWHRIKHHGNGDKEQGRTGIGLVTESKDSGENGQSGHNGNYCIGQRYFKHGAWQIVFGPHVAAVGGHYPHADRHFEEREP